MLVSNLIRALPMFHSSHLKRLRRIANNRVVLAGLLYALLLVVIYPQVFFLGKSLMPSLHLPPTTTYSEEQFPGRRPAPTFDMDISTSAYYELPLNRLIGNMYLHGQIPLWNPHQGAGTPLAAQYSSRAFFPYQILENISPYWTWDFFMLFRLWIAGFFTFLFLRAMLLNNTSAFAGGLFYMLSGVLVRFVSLEQMANVAMTLPVLLFCVEKMFNLSSARWVGWAGLAFGITLLAGQPEAALYSLFMASVFFLYRCVTSCRSLLEHLKHYTRLFLSFAFGFLLALPLILLFLEFENLSFNTHPPGGSMGIRGTLPLSLASYLILPNYRDFILFGAEVPAPGVWDFLGSYTGILVIVLAYMGLLRGGPLRKHSLFFSIFAVAIILKAFGAIPFIWIGELPFFDQAWSNRWASHTWSMGLSVAAAIGLQQVWEMVRALKARRWLANEALLSWSNARLLIIAGGLLVPGIILAIYIWGFALEDHVETSRGFVALSMFNGILLGVGSTALGVVILPKYDRAKELVWIIGAGVTFGLVVLMALRAFADPTVATVEWRLLSLWAAIGFTMTALILLMRMAAVGAVVSLYGLVALGALELWLYVPKGYDSNWQTFQLLPLVFGFGAVISLSMGMWRFALVGCACFLVGYIVLDQRSPYGYPPRADPFQEEEYISFLKDQPGNYRIAGSPKAITPNLASALGLYDVRYVDALSISAYTDYVDSALRVEPEGVDVYRLWFTGNVPGDDSGQGSFYPSLGDKLPGYSLLGAKFIVGNFDEIPDVEPLFQEGDLAIYENTEVMPRVFVSHDVEYVASQELAQSTAIEAGLNLRDKVILETSLPLPVISSSLVTSDSRAEIREYGSDRIIIDLYAQAPGVLVLTDVFYPGWKATVDGRDVDIYRANGLFRAVAVDSGKHEVQMIYDPWRFTVGLWASMLSIGTCALLIMKAQFRPWLRAFKRNMFS
jgi:hypothetical protein